jgi:hypothetical protein
MGKVPNYGSPPNLWIWPFNKWLTTPTQWRVRSVFLPDEKRETHSAYFGGSNMGKTKHFEGLLTLDAIRRVLGISRRGFAVFDVHGDLGSDLIDRLAFLYQMYPQALDGQIVVIDPTIEAWSIAYNPLILRPGELPERRAKRLADTIIQVFKDDPTVVVRMYRIAYFSFLTLIEARRSLLDLPRLLTDKKFRAGVVEDIGRPDLHRFWEHEFPSSEREALDRSESTLNRLGRLIDDPAIARMLGGTSTLNFRNLIDEGKLVIIRVPKGEIGDDAAYLLCGLMLSEFQAAAYSRSDIPKEQRRPYALVCDEFVNYLTAAIPSIISEGRKFAIELVLATQDVKSHLKTEELLSSVLNSIGNLFVFRLGFYEADTLLKDMFMPAVDQAKDVRYSYRPMGGFPNWEEHITWRSLEEIWELERRKIMTLPPRMLWWKEKGSRRTVLMKTITLNSVSSLPNAHLLPHLRAILLDDVRQHYGHLPPPPIRVIRIDEDDDIPEDIPVEE